MPDKKTARKAEAVKADSIELTDDDLSKVTGGVELPSQAQPNQFVTVPGRVFPVERPDDTEGGA